MNQKIKIFLSVFIVIAGMNIVASAELLTEGSGIQISGFESLNEWSCAGCNSLSADHDLFNEGTQGLRMTRINGGNAYITKNTNMDFASGDTFTFWVYYDNAENITSTTLYFSSDISFAKYFVWIGTGNMVTGWNRFSIAKDQFNAVGGESWNNTMIRVRLRTDLKDGKNLNTTFDDLRFNMQGRAKALIMFDDAWQDVFDNAYTILKNNNQKASVFVITRAPQEEWGDYMSTGNLTTLYAQGWDIGSHTVSHPDLTNSDPALVDPQLDLNAEINNSYNWLVSNGFTRSAKYFAYPYGYYNDTVIKSVRAKYVLARTVISGEYDAHYSLKHGSSLLLLKTREVQSGTSVDEVKSWIDEAIKKKSVVMILYHHILPGPPTVYPEDTTAASLQSVSDYLLSKSADIDVVTYNEYWNEMNSITPTVTPTQTPTATPPVLSPEVAVWDADHDGRIQKSEAVAAVVEYFAGGIMKATAVAVVAAYFNG